MATTTALDTMALATAAGGRVVRGDAHRVCERVSIDTRTIERGALFVAVRGPRFDGHDFVRDAIAAGAAAAVVDTEAVLDGLDTAGATVIVVGDTVRALQDMAHAVRIASRARVVAITGSAGKTTTKDAIATLSSRRHVTIRNRGNYNNHLGLPLSLFGLQSGAAVAVVELGMNHAGEIARLVEIAEPDIRVWTNAGTAHLGFFGTIDAIADAKAEVLGLAGPGHVLVYNADDARVAARARRFAGRTVSFGTTRQADVWADRIDERGADGVSFVAVTPRGRLDVTTPLIGRPHVSNLLAAIAVALELDVPLSEFASTLAGFTAAPHRGEVHRLRDGIVLIDDCYNASPSAVEAMLAASARQHRGRYVACLGEMLELGEATESMHRHVARAVVDAGVGALVTVGGPAARILADEAIALGLPASHVYHDDDSTRAADRLSALVEAGDLVLVKGSRGVHLDVVVDRLRQEEA